MTTVTCPTCGHVGAPTRRGTVRNHAEPGPGRATDRMPCLGSGRLPTIGLLPSIGADGRCTGCGRVPDERTGRCGCEGS